jgi:hypothetical protein
METTTVLFIPIVLCPYITLETFVVLHYLNSCPIGFTGFSPCIVGKRE